MKLGWIVVFLFLVSIFFVEAALEVPCSEDRDCSFSLGKDGYSCVQRTCEKAELSESGLTFTPAGQKLQWHLFSVEGSEEIVCDPSQGCLQFAPVQENWWTRFVDFLLYV